MRAVIAACSSGVGVRPFSAWNLSTCWSIAALKKNARIAGAGPLMVIETLVFGSQRSNPTNSFFMSSSVQMLTPDSPILP